MELSEIAVKNSGWVWCKLREARKHNYQIGEESITDFFILNLKKYGKGKILVDTFTRRKEAFTGADWEWWLTGSSGKWLGMRVQAKVINLKNEAYEHLHYKNKNGHQADTLIKDAANNDLVPLYCMYSNWDPYTHNTKLKCKCRNHSVYYYGTSIMNPLDVITLRPDKQLSKVIKLLRPLQCLFCASTYGGSDLPTNALKYSKTAGLVSTDTDNIDNTDNGNSVEFLKDNPPDYVSQLLQGVIEPDYIDLPDERIKRVTIIRETNID